jgi:hypothetical protein
MGSDYDNWKLSSRENEEDRYYARQQRENDRIDKEEYLAECAKDDALTKEEPEWERPKYDSYWEKRELTEDEEYEVKHKMYEFQKQQRWEQDVAACQRSMRGGY